MITPTLQLVYELLLIVGKLITAIGIPVVLLYKEQGAKRFCSISLWDLENKAHLALVRSLAAFLAPPPFFFTHRYSAWISENLVPFSAMTFLYIRIIKLNEAQSLCQM